MTAVMRAVLLREVGVAPTLAEIDRPAPGPGEVRVAVSACGICGSDLHAVAGEIPLGELPLVLGHEASGTVEALGDGVTGVAPGDRVLVNPILTCGRCRACRAGATNRCPRGRVLGVAVPGAAADAVVVPAGNLHRVPESLDLPTAAILADAVAGPFHAVRTAGIGPGDTVAVFGLGGLGLHAAMVLHQLAGARVIGVDVSERALERAAAAGVDVVVDGRDGRANDAVVAAADGGVDASFEFVGSVAVAEAALRCLRPGGRAVVMGVSPDKLALGVTLGSLVAREWTLTGSYGYTPADLDDLLGLVGRGELVLDGTITHRLPLEAFADGLDLLRDPSHGAVRVLVEPGRPT